MTREQALEAALRALLPILDNDGPLVEAYADVWEQCEAALGMPSNAMLALKDAEKRLRGAGMLGGEDDLIRIALCEGATGQE